MMLIKDLGSLGTKKSHDTMNLNEISWSKLFLICEEEGGLDDKTTQNILNHKWFNCMTSHIDKTLISTTLGFNFTVMICWRNHHH